MRMIDPLTHTSTATSPSRGRGKKRELLAHCGAWYLATYDAQDAPSCRVCRQALIDAENTADAIARDEAALLAKLEAQEAIRRNAILAQQKESTVTVKIIANDRGNPPGKLADAELHFTDGPLAGVKLIGFGIWERRGAGNKRNVTFPARQYSVNGERRSFALLRPITDVDGQEAVRQLVLDAFEAYGESQVVK